MNRLLVILMFSCMPILSNAQFVTFYDQLEGLWQHRQAPEQYSEWRFIDDKTLAWRVFEVSGADTLVQTLGKINCEKLELTVLGGLPVAMNLSLDKSNCDHIVWKNADHTISWTVFAREVSVDHNGKINTYRYRKQRSAVHVQTGLRVLGAYGTTWGALNRNQPLYRDHRPQTDFSAGQAAMSAVALGIGFRESPMSFQLEFGWARRTLGAVVTSTPQGSTFTQQGTYDLRSTYFALVPTLTLDRNKKWAAQGGVYIRANGKSGFSGTAAYTELNFGTYQSSPVEINGENGMLLGLIYRPLAARKSLLQPELFARYTVPVVGMYRAHSLMTGVSIRLGH